MGKPLSITACRRRFIEPRNATHRQYEALRAYFVDGLSSADAAAKFGYTAGTFRVMCHKFRRSPDRHFFVPEGSRGGAVEHDDERRDKKGRVRKLIVSMRKQNMSVYDIATALQRSGHKLSPVSVWHALKKEGFGPLPRRKDEERPPSTRPEPAPIADARQFRVTSNEFQTSFGGIFLFVPWLVDARFDGIVKRLGFPGTKMVPAPCAMRSLLALKLAGKARRGHVMSHVFDNGLAFFGALNAVPKRSFLAEYSCRIDPRLYPKLMRSWFDAANRLGVERGVSFDLDFHTIPYHGDDALVEKHYVSKRSRKQKGMLAFLAQDADKRVFCYANAEIRKTEQNDEILRFIQFWKKRTGTLPEEIVFDSKLTTYPNINRIDKMGIRFITLRRRGRKLLDDLANVPASAWRRIVLDGVSRVYRTPRILDQEVVLKGYDRPIRQIAIVDLGHEHPTLLLTNQKRRSAKKLIERYAQRMLIENGIADGIDFFHIDALSSAVAMKISCDLQLTLIGSSLYRLLGARVGHGYETAKSSHIFRDLVDATARVSVTSDAVTVRFPKRAHNPLLLKAGFAESETKVPWWGRKKLRFSFG